MSGKKAYTTKRPAHPEEAHTKAKRFFKRKGRKRVRTILKKETKNAE
ncbi:MAG: hypothetical protein WCJ46_07705 [bacterium]